MPWCSSIYRLRIVISLIYDLMAKRSDDCQSWCLLQVPAGQEWSGADQDKIKGTFPPARNGCGADSGTATDNGCRPRLYVSTTADSLRECRGSAVASLQQKMEFYPFNFKWFRPCLHLSKITEQYTWNECLTYKNYVQLSWLLCTAGIIVG